jgi:hypothetical protein
MAEVKALFPVGKTQWRKWRPEQQIAFNEARASGVPFADAVDYVNRLELIEVNIAPQPKKKPSVADVLRDVTEAAIAVSGTVGAIDGTVKVVKRAVRKKKAK